MPQLPLHALHQKLGANFKTEFNRDIPADYGDPLKEYQAAREDVALADLSHQGKFIVSGADAAAFLQGLISNDLSLASDHSGIYATLLTAKGKTLSDFYLFPLPEGFLMEVDGGNAENTKNHLMRFRLRSKVEMSVPPWGMLLVSGPSSTKLLEKVVGVPLPEMTEKFFFEKEVDGARLICIKRSVTGETDFHLYCPVDHIEALWRKFLSEGEALNIQPAGQTALDVLRVEAGKPKYGMELDEDTLPVEAGLQDEAISYTKGCFPGQEVVARIKTYGHVNRLLSGLIVDEETLPHKGSAVFHDDKKIGWVTSAVHSPRIGKIIAMAYVRREAATPGTEARIDLGNGKDVSAQVVALPFYQKQDEEH
ncbi:MAG: aminomethyltransferase family protein [Nitrospiria bacterium]